MSPKRREGGANEYSCAHGAQINFGDLTPYLTYDRNTVLFEVYFLCPIIMKGAKGVAKLEVYDE